MTDLKKETESHAEKQLDKFIERRLNIKENEIEKDLWKLVDLIYGKEGNEFAELLLKMKEQAFKSGSLSKEKEVLEIIDKLPEENLYTTKKDPKWKGDLEDDWQPIIKVLDITKKQLKNKIKGK
jgi:hypothetical protein